MGKEGKAAEMYVPDLARPKQSVKIGALKMTVGNIGRGGGQTDDRYDQPVRLTVEGSDVGC